MFYFQCQLLQELSDRLSAVSPSGAAILVVDCLSTSGHSWEAGRVSHSLKMKNPNHTLKKKITMKNLNVIPRT